VMKLAAAFAKAAAAIGGGIGNYKPGAGVQQWRGTVSQALSQAGSSQQLVDAVLYQMQTESGGNPTIVNRWDSNWIAGHPSVGLMQVIRGTFQAYAGRYRNTGPFAYGVSENPMANVYSAIKYAQSNYGPGLRNAYGGIGSGHGYAYGTSSAAPGFAWVGERGPELVKFRGGEQVGPYAGRGGGGNTYNITVNVPPTASKADTGRAVVECIREYERGSGTRWRK
jgi:SLT domain-containing protein